MILIHFNNKDFIKLEEWKYKDLEEELKKQNVKIGDNKILILKPKWNNDVFNNIHIKLDKINYIEESDF